MTPKLALICIVDGSLLLLVSGAEASLGKYIITGRFCKKPILREYGITFAYITFDIVISAEKN
jgi:hypothetical protein